MTHVLYTGPIKGTVTLADGTAVDVKPDVIYLDSHEQALEVAALIGERHATEGHPAHEHGDQFIHDTAAPTLED